MSSNRDGIETAAGNDEVDSVEQVGEYSVPVNPMDDLDCESCQ